MNKFSLWVLVQDPFFVQQSASHGKFDSLKEKYEDAGYRVEAAHCFLIEKMIVLSKFCSSFLSLLKYQSCEKW
jgi:hypothetical protein